MKTIRQFARDGVERVIGAPSVPMGHPQLNISKETEDRIETFRRIRETRDDVINRATDALENNKQHKRRQLRHYIASAAVLAGSVTGSIFMAHSDPKPAPHNTSHTATYSTSLKSEKRN